MGGGDFSLVLLVLLPDAEAARLAAAFLDDDLVAMMLVHVSTRNALVDVENGKGICTFASSEFRISKCRVGVVGVVMSRDVNILARWTRVEIRAIFIGCELNTGTKPIIYFGSGCSLTGYRALI